MPPNRPNRREWRLPTAARVALVLLVAALVLVSQSAAAEVPAARASLADSISPYLQLHADDPVAWREWSPDLLEQARASNRPLLISSGYFACHWCHVMQQESFKDVGIAERLNRDYIPVKIDRELQGALDDYLLEFLRATRGSAGWPLNVVILPTGDALSGVVYAPRDDFAAFLDRITGLLDDDADALTRLAREGRLELTARLRAGETPLSAARAARLPQVLWATLEREADFLAGGFGDQSKFPQAPVLEALLQAKATGHGPAWAGEFLEVTLDEMARAGLRDVLGGGFFRYSETPDWGRPHFEIMLEDQAQLARLYLRGARLLDRPDWFEIGRETLAFVEREMRLGDDVLFASGLSALDAAGREGGFYLWTEPQLAAALDGHPEPDLVRAYFALTGAPSFEQGHLPQRHMALEALAGRFDLTPEAARLQIEAGRTRLLEQRAERGLPRDEKALTGVHGLLLSAFAEARDDPRLARIGDRLAERLRSLAARPDALAQLLDRPSAVAGAADLADFAYLAQGLHDWAVATGAPSDPAVEGLLEAAWNGFNDADGWRAARELPLPGMVAQRFHASVHRPSPTTLVLALSQTYQDGSEALAEHLAAFVPTPGRAIETTAREHAGLILWLTEDWTRWNPPGNPAMSLENGVRNTAISDTGRL